MGLKWRVGHRRNIDDHRFDPPRVRTVADAVDGDRRKEPMTELAEALDRAAAGVRAVPTSTSPEIKSTLLALLDALTEIAAVLPAPHTVPKE